MGSFGFTPKYQTTVYLDSLSGQDYLAIAIEAIKNIGWETNYQSKTGLIVVTSTAIFSNKQQVTIRLQETTVDIKSESLGRGMYDWGRNEANVDSFINEFDSVRAKLTEDELEERKVALEPLFNSDKKDLLAEPEESGIKSFFSLFVPREGFFVTPLIIDINIAVFILMLIGGVNVLLPETSSLITWGGNLRALVLTGQQWRLLTNVFVHAGVLHLLLNMYALVYIGILLEPYLGKARFLLAYLITGVIGSLTSVYWHPVTVSVGASGAIFGMYGVFLAMLTTNIIEKKAQQSLLTSITIFVILNLANGMKAGIDAAAHIGGLASGVVLGYIFYPVLKNPQQAKLGSLTFAGAIAFFVLSSFVIYRQIPADVAKYDALVKQFGSNEDEALKVFKDLSQQSKEETLKELSRGEVYWQKNISIVQQLDSLDIPVDFTMKDAGLKKYCRLRLKSYDFMLKAVTDTSNLALRDSIRSYNSQIETVLNDLKGKQ